MLQMKYETTLTQNVCHIQNTFTFIIKNAYGQHSLPAKGGTLLFDYSVVQLFIQRKLGAFNYPVYMYMKSKQTLCAILKLHIAIEMEKIAGKH